ncbi:MAG: PolC-type DNA polymerase III [Clostridia bacterium]|nr:PolC-type DNA polymerase III [Clostridia bacterium]
MAKSILDVFDIKSDGLKKYKCISVDKVDILKEEAKLKVQATTTAFVSQKEIDYLKNTIEKKNNNKFVCDIIMRYEIEGDNRNLFIEDYFDWLISGLRAKRPIMYTILSRANKEITDDKIVFSVSDIAKDTLNKNEFVQRVQKDLYSKYGINIRVEYKIIEDEDDAINSEFEQIQRDEILKNRIGENATTLVTNNSRPQNNFGYQGPKRMVVEDVDKKENEDERDKTLIIGGKISADANFIDLSTINDYQGSNVYTKGEVFYVEENETKSGKMIVKFYITNYKQSVTCKFFATKEKYDRDVKLNFYNDKGKLKKGLPLKIYGTYDYDDYEKESLISARQIQIGEPFEKRCDNYEGEMKRIELHMHTEMSDMDALCPADEIISTASRWGHKAIAITDHGNVQSFPIAEHNKGDMKILYGVEAYLVDDVSGNVRCVDGDQSYSIDDEVVVFDIETTGFNKTNCKITEIGAVKVSGGKIIDRFSSFVNPECAIPERIVELTHITDDMVKDAPTIKDVLPKFLEFIGDSPVVAHNASFDTGFIRYNAQELKLKFNPIIIDTLQLSRKLFPELPNHKLDTLVTHLHVVNIGAHRAVNDAEATAEAYLKIVEILKEKYEIKDTNEVNMKLGGVDPTSLKPYHCIIFAKNTKAIRYLYILVSDAHVKYFKRFPLTPKSEVLKYREHFIIGSACEAGELYQGMLSGKSDDELKDIVDFYDYLEIQPLQNNAFMLDKTVHYDRKGNAKEDKYPTVQTEEDLRNYNRRICALGEKYNKPVVATSDAHFLEPNEDIARKIILASKGYDDADRDSGLYLKTTQEMLDEMSYLGEEKAYEVVVKNTNLVADMIEDTCPLSPDKATPYFDHCEEDFRQICDETAHAMYGPNLPVQVEERLQIERDSIIENGYTVLYMIAQKLVKKSNDDGYLVGSRGSVGSSFAATMSGITEVNPLPAHYACPNCHYVEFDSERVKAFAGMSGCDMPEANCPNCGTRLNKWGHDIPFQTFLGFNADKEPDIDLNFSGDYQPKVHAYTEQLFGKGHAYRAGTIGTLADKTAYGSAKKYFEERNQAVSKAELQRIIDRAVGTRRTTGQHPGGIVVLPKDRDIYDFCPIQWPANDMTAALETTHFDYHSIDSNLLKLDILGHDDPTMIRFLEDITGMDAKSIELGDPGVMGLFKGLDTLKVMPKGERQIPYEVVNDINAPGVKSEDIDGVKLGILGVPEFGTPFAMQMVIDTSPESFSDLVRISGLSHGTDVWLGNAQTLIQEGKAKLSECICCRDDIMIFLINKGLEKGLSFKIMESVRKGKGLTPEMEEAMINNGGLPDWYIDSCKKIKYMFPKAHAVAYVMMAWRIAWFKVYMPQAYYAAFLGIRAKALDYEKMCNGKERVEKEMAILKEQQAQKIISNKDEDLLGVLKIVQEFYARGLEFAKIDLYKSKGKLFQITEDNKVLPSFMAIPGLGENVAMAIEEEAKKAPFATIDEFVERTKANKTVVEILKQNGILDGIPESNQISLFDMGF